MTGNEDIEKLIICTEIRVLLQDVQKICKKWSKNLFHATTTQSVVVSLDQVWAVKNRISEVENLLDKLEGE